MLGEIAAVEERNLIWTVDYVVGDFFHLNITLAVGNDVIYKLVLLLNVAFLQFLNISQFGYWLYEEFLWEEVNPVLSH